MKATAADDALLHGPGDLRLHRDREVAPDVLEERPVGLREVERIGREPLHRLLAVGEHLAAVLEALRLGVTYGSMRSLIDR